MTTNSSAAQQRLIEYGRFHATPGNVACHWVGIPLIVVSLFGLLARVPLFPIGGFTVTASEVLIVFATVYYLRLEVALAAMMVPVSVGLSLVGRVLPFEVNVGLLIVGWIFQFVGHAVYEKRRPAFFDDLASLLIGPLFLVAKAIRRA
jgi:uncharacterized membrane protein YGL010W